MPISTLIVSPDPGLARQVGGILETRGWSATYSGSAASALAQCRTGDFPLVVAEVDLPDGSGFEVCRSIKGMEGAPAVLLLYSMGEGSVERNARDCGADALLRRPFLAAKLLECIDAMIRGEGSLGPDGHGGDPNAGLLLLSDSVPALRTGDFEALLSSEVDVVDESTEDLPPVAIEAFDEENPVSVPVRPDATAHALPPVGRAGSDDPAVDSFEDFPRVAFQPDALAPDSGELSVDPSIREAARIRRAVDAEIEEMFRPGGRVEQLIRDAVAKAVAAVLANR